MSFPYVKKNKEPFLLGKDIAREFILYDKFFNDVLRTNVEVGEEGQSYFYSQFYIPAKKYFDNEHQNEEAFNHLILDYFSGVFNRYSNMSIQEFFNRKELSEKLGGEGFFVDNAISPFSEKILNIMQKKDGINDYNSRIFVSKVGHISKLHFDWKAQANILFQVSGTKKIKLYKTDKSIDLGIAGNLAKRDITLAPDFEFILESNDALYIPPLYWHEVETIENSISFSFRYFSDPFIGYMVNNTPPSWKLLDLYFNSIIEDKINKQLIIKETKKELANGLKNHEFLESFIYYTWAKFYELYVLADQKSIKSQIQFLNSSKNNNIYEFAYNLNMI